MTENRRPRFVSDECPVEPERATELNDREPADGAAYVLYWMQQSQRAVCNPALEFACGLANRLGAPLLVCFGLTGNYPEANLRHYRFLLEGLQNVKVALAARGIPFVVRRGPPPETALQLGEKAAAIVTDRGYLRHQRQWRSEVAAKARCPVLEVEGDAVVPVAAASDKREYAARTIRGKLHGTVDRFLNPLPQVTLDKPLRDQIPAGENLDDLAGIEAKLSIERSVEPVSQFYRGGEDEAARIFKYFLEELLPDYADNRNQPQTDFVSRMSMYLHFGHVSPVWLLLELRKRASDENTDAFIEELLVRRELAVNYVWYTQEYDKYSALPDWARQTLDEHRDDSRWPAYTEEQLESAQTSDPYWNAAMQEMRKTGYMHNYMRMYWGKKILEWSASPEEAFATALRLNNRYFLDGRDPASFANVGWIFGLHDRPWAERKVFGKTRYMSASGLERKCRIEDYVRKVEVF